MRHSLPSLLLALAVAGCLGSSGPASTTPASLTPVDVHVTHDFSAADETKTFTLPANGGTGHLHLGFDGPVTQSTLTIEVKDPSGASVAKATLGGTTIAPGGTDSNPVNKDVPLVRGTWTVEFHGTGTAGTGRLDLTNG